MKTVVEWTANVDGGPDAKYLGHDFYDEGGDREIKFVCAHCQLTLLPTPNDHTMYDSLEFLLRRVTTRCSWLEEQL